MVQLLDCVGASAPAQLLCSAENESHLKNTKSILFCILSVACFALSVLNDVVDIVQNRHNK